MTNQWFTPRLDAWSPPHATSPSLSHPSQLFQESGVAYSDMLFFDNERWNITGRAGESGAGSEPV
jgi:hypothetical protein